MGDIGRALIRDAANVPGRAPRPEDVGWQEQLDKEVHVQGIVFLSKICRTYVVVGCHCTHAAYCFAGCGPL